MKCPVCVESVLVMSSREGVEIDYCPNCRGVWLDRGELDKIIERSMAETGAARTSAVQPAYGQVPRTDCDGGGTYGNHPEGAS